MWKTCMTASVDYEGKLGPIKLASGLHMLLESLFQARKSSGHIYVCLLYRLSLCDFFYWILEPFQPCDISIGFCNCSDSVIFFELFRQCDMFLTVPTMWYFFNCSDSVIFFNCSDSVIFFELFRQCDMFWTVPTVWYFLNCSDSVIFFELFRQWEIFVVFHFIPL
jgi:hypothetical protein